MAAAPRGHLVVTSLTLGTIISLHHVLDSMAIRSTAMLTIANKTYRQLNITKRDDTVTLISMFHCDSNVSLLTNLKETMTRSSYVQKQIHWYLCYR
jgi:hypothetical protein